MGKVKISPFAALGEIYFMNKRPSNLARVSIIVISILFSQYIVAQISSTETKTSQASQKATQETADFLKLLAPQIKPGNKLTPQKHTIIPHTGWSIIETNPPMYYMLQHDSGNIMMHVLYFDHFNGSSEEAMCKNIILNTNTLVDFTILNTWSLSIENRHWSAYTATYASQKETKKTAAFIYSGTEGLYQIRAVANSADFDKNYEMIIKAMGCLKINAPSQPAKNTSSDNKNRDLQKVYGSEGCYYLTAPKTWMKSPTKINTIDLLIMSSSGAIVVALGTNAKGKNDMPPDAFWKDKLKETTPDCEFFDNGRASMNRVTWKSFVAVSKTEKTNMQCHATYWNEKYYLVSSYQFGKEDKATRDEMYDIFKSFTFVNNVTMNQAFQK